MNSKQYFIILGTILLVISMLLMFVPTSKKDVVVTTTIENKILLSPSIETSNAILVPNTIINLRTASIFDIFESGDLTVSIISGGKTVTKNIGTITETDSKEVTLRITNVPLATSKVIIKLYEDSTLKDTKEININ